MTHFVGNHIGLRKVTRRTQPVFQGLIKAEVDIHLLVTRTVKRAHGSLARAAGGGRHTPKQHQFGFGVGRAALGEHILPDVFGVGQHRGDKFGHAVVSGRPLGWCLLHLRGGRTTAAEQAQDGERIDAKNPPPQQRNHDRADANTAPAHQTTQTAAPPCTTVFHVV